MLGDGSFAAGLDDWQSRYGSLRHSDKTYVGAPGAALLVTDQLAADGSRVAVAGRCLDLHAPAATSTGSAHEFTVEAYLLAMPETESIALSVFFHAEAGCRGEILDVFGPPAVLPESGWTFISASLPIPPDAASADLVLRASGSSPSGRALADRLCAFFH